jgi:membrane protease subunit (stomatin/prohibitin family)
MPFLEIIEYQDKTGTELVHRVPEEGSGETQFGSQLVVREHQAAIFFHAGKGLDVFGPGRYTLSTRNLPLLTKILALPWGFKSRFRTEVYFVNQKIFTNLRWGTKDPVAFRDDELGLVRLRAFGSYTMRISQPLLFLNTVVGARPEFDTAEIEDFLREVIISRLNDFLGETVDTLLNLPKYYNEMAVKVKERLTADFDKYGIELKDFLINRITPPEEVQKILDERTGMAAVGDLDQFFKFKAAKALGEAASSGGISGAGAGIGMGMGAGMGMLIPGMLYKSLQAEGQQQGKAIEQGAMVNCPDCYGEVPLDARFCPHCGNQMVVMRKCTRCSKNVTAAAKFCPACGLNLSSELHCRSCDTKLPPATKFCFHCGEGQQAALPEANA